MELMDFFVDRWIEMSFIVKSNASPIYINAYMNNKIKITSSMNYLRYRRLEEIKSIKLVDLKGRTLEDIKLERG